MNLSFYIFFILIYFFTKINLVHISLACNLESVWKMSNNLIGHMTFICHAPAWTDTMTRTKLKLKFAYVGYVRNTIHKRVRDDT